nr:hypothetical protein [Tanacetum cinerariifolium]
ARVSGYLKDWSADIGTQVQAGQVLAQIDSPELDQQLAQTRAHLAQQQATARIAETTAARWQHLLATHSVSQQEVDEKVSAATAAKADMQAAAADCQRLSDLAAYKTIRAPFSGTITARNTDIGATERARAPRQDLYRDTDGRLHGDRSALRHPARPIRCRQSRRCPAARRLRRRDLAGERWQPRHEHPCQRADLPCQGHAGGDHGHDGACAPAQHPYRDGPGRSAGDRSGASGGRQGDRQPARCGCSLAPTYHAPDIPLPAHYKEQAGPWHPAQPADRIQPQWWQVFEDKQLNDLQQQLLKANPDLAAALAHYDASQAYASQLH